MRKSFLSDEELMHAILFDVGTDKECANIKILIDVGWHCQNYEGYAETIAKIIGYIYNDNSKKMEFKNLRRKTLSKMWLPSDEKHNEELEDDLVK